MFQISSQHLNQSKDTSDMKRDNMHFPALKKLESEQLYNQKIELDPNMINYLKTNKFLFLLFELEWNRK